MRYRSLSLRYRIVVSVVLIEALMLSAMIWSNVSQVRQTHADRLEQSAQVILDQFTTTAGRYLFEVDYASLQEYADNVLSYNELAYSVVEGANGQVVIATGDLPEIEQLRAGVSDPRPNIFVVKDEISLGGKRRGAVHLGFTTAVMEQTATIALRRGLQIAAGAILLSIFAAYAVGTLLTRNLETLVGFAQRFGQGEHDLSIPIKTWDETGMVANAFNEMVQQRQIAERQRLRDLEILRRNEAALNNAQRMAHVGNWEWNIATGELAWSDEIYRIFGRQPQEFGATYEAFLETIHPDDRDAVVEAVNRAVAGEKEYGIDHRIVLPDGEVRHVSEQGEVTRDQDGNPVHMSGVVLDTTERKQSDAYLETLFASMIDGLIVIDKVGAIQNFNPAAEEIFGYEAEEVIGQNVKILMPPAEREEHDTHLENYRSTGKSTVIGINRTLLGQRKDGSTFPIELSVSEAEHDQTKLIVGLVRDISDRARTAEILQWLQLISDTAPINLGYLDTEPRYRYVNQGIENLYGLTQDEIVGKHVREIQGEDVYRRNLPRIEAVLRGEQVTFEQERRMSGGKGQYYQSTYVPHFDDSGEVLGYYTVSIDITDRKRSEDNVQQLNRTLEHRVEQRTEELSQANEQLTGAMVELKVAQNSMIQSEKLTALGTLLAGIAHEMNNPMMGIQNYVDYALRHSENAKVKEVLGKADREVIRVTGIVSNMLRYARPALETSSNIDVGKVVEDTLALTETDLRDNLVSVETNFPSTLPKAWARPDSLQQVLLNLVLNARDAMAECEEKRLEIKGRHENGCVVVDIEDSGAGIPELLQERIFDPFFSTKPPGSGTGMGLAVSRQIIEGLDGTLVYENQAGRGAKFTITLPTHPSTDRKVPGARPAMELHDTH